MSGPFPMSGGIFFGSTSTSRLLSARMIVGWPLRTPAAQRFATAIRQCGRLQTPDISR